MLYLSARRRPGRDSPALLRSEPVTKRLMFLSALILLGIIALARTTSTQAQQADPPVVINEIFDSANPSNEFFELYNLTTSDIDLSSYVIYNRNGQDALSEPD